MFGALDISTSGMVAQRTRLNAVSANLANRFSTHDAEGNYAPYRRRVPVLATGDPATGSEAGVHVREIRFDASPFRKVHEPGHPDADAEGYVSYPNIDPAMEMVNALEASRAYEANITAAEATKSMYNSALRLLA
jgi:flagellar basal-body rod protein FlgC